MKIFALLSGLAAVILSAVPVLASSTNYVSKSLAVNDGSDLSSASIIIRPLDEVQTGDSIIIRFENATVYDQSTLDGSGRFTGIQYKVNGKTWMGEEDGSFQDIMPYTSSTELPYYVRKISSSEVEVLLCNIPDVYAGSTLKTVNGVDKWARYSIPIPAYADTNSDTAVEIRAYIDSNSSSISSGEVFGGAITTGNTKKETSTRSTITTTETTTETTTQTVERSKGSKSIFVQIGADSVSTSDGKSVELDVPAYIQRASNSAMMPLRAVSYALSEISGENKEILWDAETKTATIFFGDKEIAFTAGSEYVSINGKKTEMKYGVVAEITDSRMFIPFRALGEALGAEINWDAETKTASYTVEK